MNGSVQHDTNGTTDNSMKNLILTIREWIVYLFPKWYLILVFGILGAGVGFWNAKSKKSIYTATTTFVLENAGATQSSPYAGIAASLGVNLGGSQGGGIFVGENILELYRSRSMITKVLLSIDTFGGKPQMLIDRYIEFNKLDEYWNKSPLLKNIKFTPTNTYEQPALQLLHDSIIGNIVKDIGTNQLDIGKIDRKLSVIYIKVNSPDELFAKSFNRYLVKTVNAFYLYTKTKKSIENVAILQKKTDSIYGIIKGSVSQAAAVADATPNQNPTRMAQRLVPIQNAQSRVEVNSGILGQLVQNLELSKIALQKETPLIQIVDEPILPLDKESASKLVSLIIGGLLGGLLIVLFLIVRRLLKIILQ